jgi:hypothetical protein
MTPEERTKGAPMSEWRKRQVQDLAQPEQEPVAWRYRTGTFFNREIHWRYMDSLEGTEKLLGIQPLYTAPAQRTWVGLTDEDKHLIELSAGITEDDDGYIVSQVFKLTEAKLRSKNNAT